MCYFAILEQKNLIRLLLEAKDAKILEKEMKNVVEFFKKALNG